MLIVYDSRFGKGKSFAEKLGYPNQSVSEPINEKCILVTRNEGLGDIPANTIDFLDKNATNVEAVIVNGNMERHADTYCFAAEKIQDKYNISCVRKIDGEGNDEDIAAVKEAIEKL